MDALVERICQLCGSHYVPTAFGQKYCGRQKIKGTCSWKVGEQKRIVWLKKNPELRRQYYQRYIANNIDNELKRTFLRRLALYGLTIAKFDELATRQNGLCALCGYTPGNKGLQIDHDHRTGQVRGLLCMTCNTRLGYVESPWMELAKKYLEQS